MPKGNPGSALSAYCGEEAGLGLRKVTVKTRRHGSDSQAHNSDLADTKLLEVRFLLIQTKWLPGIIFFKQLFFLSSGLKMYKNVMCD